jgi:hypothetical protein
VHVASRAALMSALHRRALGGLAALITAEVAGRSGREALGGFAEAHRALASGRPGAWAALQQVADTATATSPEAAAVADLALAVLRGYGIGADEAVHATRLVSSTVNGFVTLERAGAFGHRAVEVGASWHRAVAALDRALASWPDGG